MQKVQFLIGLICMLFSWSCSSSHISNYSPNQKYAASVLKEDVQILEKILESNHPSLYWYTPKEKMDGYFAETINSINDSMNEVQFRNKIAALVSQIHCGHTVVLNSNEFAKVNSKIRLPQFPLAIKTWDDSMVVVASIYPKATNIKRGTIITSINGRTNKEMLDSFYKYISIDGNVASYKSQRVSNNFGAWYKNVFGLDTSYLIGYIDSIGVERKEKLRTFRMPVLDKSKMDSLQKLLASYKVPTKKEIRKQRRNAQLSLKFDDTTSTAYMHLAGFSVNGLQKFMRHSFKQLDAHQAKNLVIDVRDNGGGHLNNSIRLTRYLAKQPFKVADTVAAINRNFVQGKYIHQSFWFWFPLNFNTTKMEDGRYHYHRFETIKYQPFSKHHFDGKIYLLQGPTTFSAATVFTGSLKGQDNVKLVGEETGGGYYGNSAIHLPTIILPNSKIQVTLPLFRVVLDKDRPKGRGVMPDVLVPPNSFAIKKGVDNKIEYIRAQVKR
jgi:C-terminal processing protease CtpA/Prc